MIRGRYSKSVHAGHSHPPDIQRVVIMTTNAGHTLSHDLSFTPLSLEAERLAMQLEQALRDPSASKDVFFQALDRYSDVLTLLNQHRQTSELVKH